MDVDRASLQDVRPPAAWVERYTRSGAWTDTTILDDLYRLASEQPDATALVAHREGEVARITYAAYAAAVDRYAAALRELGVGPGDTVALWMPNRRQVPPLLLAVWSLGALAAPVMTTIGSRELERMLARLDARVCVTVDENEGVRHADVLRDVAGRLPHLEHQVVLGAPGDGQLDFATALGSNLETGPATVPRANLDAVDPNRVCLALFTSGTTGEPKATLHTLNTFAFFPTTWATAIGLHAADRILCPHALTHAAGLWLDVFVPLRTGGAALLLERWDPATAAALMAAEHVSLWVAAPPFLTGLLDVLRVDGPGLPALRQLHSIATTIPRRQVGQVSERLGVPLLTTWAMTEGGGTYTRPADGSDPATAGIGRPITGTEIMIAEDGGQPVTARTPGRLLIRGPGVCVATVGRDSGTVDVVAERDDGWYDTGDLAYRLGAGNLQLAGRAADRVGGTFMIPVADVEDALREHPALTDAAVIGLPGDEGGEDGGKDGELACAVVTVATGERPTLDGIRSFLLAGGMTEWYLPRRLEIVDTLPRNPTGKVEKKLLRDTYAAASPLELGADFFVDP